MKNILFFGDSNTYGYKPDKSGRYDYDVRWTGRIANLLGNEYNIIEEGLCGRTTIFPDAVRDARKGIDLIGVVVESHKPVDVIAIMLGTNDCKTEFHADAKTIAKGMEAVARKANKTAGEQRFPQSAVRYVITGQQRAQHKGGSSVSAVIQPYLLLIQSQAACI